MDRSFTSIAALLFFALIPQSVSAAILFSDDFNRAVGPTVGNGWSEFEMGPKDVSIIGGGTTRKKGDNALRIRDSNGQSAQFALSTVGYSDIMLSYDWAPLVDSDAGDTLFIEWRPGNAGSWNALSSQSLGGGGSYTNVAPINLGPSASNISPLQLEFRITVLMNDVGDVGEFIRSEGAMIGNVMLFGTEIPSTSAILSTSAPEPSSLAVWGCLALVGVACARRRNAA